MSLFKLFVNLFVICVFACAVSAQRITTHDTEDAAKKNAGQGVTFKIPKKAMVQKWKDFKGLLLLGAEGPWGIYISYPNDGESLEQLRERMQQSLAGMFIPNVGKNEKAQWKTETISSNKGDKSENGVMKIYDEDDRAVHVAFYEREWNNLGFVYGYFEMFKKERDYKTSAFLDEDRKSRKLFDEFWKTFPKK